MRPVVTLLAVLLLGFGLWHLVTPDDGDTGRVQGDFPTKRDASPAVLRGVAAARATPQDGEQKAEEGSAKEQAGPGSRIVLPVRLRVEGQEASFPLDPPAELSLSAVFFRFESTFDFDYIEVPIAAAGEHALDVSKAVREYWDKRGDRGGDLHLTHPAYMPVHLRIPLPDAPDPRPETLTLEPVDLVLRPAAELTGRVVGPDGKPLHGASALLYSVTDGVPDRMPVALQSTGKSGGFRLRYGADGRYLLVATWGDYAVEQMSIQLEARLRPASELLDLALEGKPRDVVLRLKPAHALRGRILTNGRPAKYPDLDWHLDAKGQRLATELTREEFDWGGLIHAAGEVHWGWGEAEIEADGSFEILGLSPRAYRLTVTSLANAQLHRKAFEAAAQVATPPRDDVVLDIPVAHLDIRVTLDRTPVRNGEVHVHAVGMEPGLPEGVTWGTRKLTTKDTGRVGLSVSPGHLYSVVVRDKRCEVHHAKVTAPAAGETTVIDARLQRAQPKPRLILTLVGEGAEAIRGAGFGFYPPEKSRADRTPWPIRPWVKPEDGRFVLADLEPGRNRLHVRPGRPWSATPGAWAEAERLVQIPATGDLELTMPIAKGGRLQVTAIDKHGRHLPAACLIRDAEGALVPARFAARGEFERIVATNALPGAGACWVEPVLAPGVYTLAFQLEGYRDETRRVELKAGEATAVRIEMKSLR